MRGPDSRHLDELTAPAERWLRRCNDKPREGIPVGRTELRAVLAASVDVEIDSLGRITWRAAGCQSRSLFTAEPISDDPGQDAVGQPPPIARAGHAS